MSTNFDPEVATCDGKTRDGYLCQQAATWRVWAEDEDAAMFACHHHLSLIVGHVLGSERGTDRELRVTGASREPATYAPVAHVDRLWP
jgi:hypothetical protein